MLAERSVAVAVPTTQCTRTVYSDNLCIKFADSVQHFNFVKKNYSLNTAFL